MCGGFQSGGVAVGGLQIAVVFLLPAFHRRELRRHGALQDGRATLRIGFLANRLVDKTVSGSQNGMLTRIGGYCLCMAPDSEAQEHQQDEDAGIA